LNLTHSTEQGYAPEDSWEVRFEVAYYCIKGRNTVQFGM